jgi:hypothetical protein
MWVLHLAAGIEVEPQKEIFDQWGRFVARGDYGSWALDEFMSTTATSIATGRRTAATLGATVDWSRLNGNGWVSPHTNCSMRAPPSAPVPTACSGGAGIRSDFVRWEALLDDSPFRPAGRAKVARHWERALTNCGRAAALPHGNVSLAHSFCG